MSEGALRVAAFRKSVQSNSPTLLRRCVVEVLSFDLSLDALWPERLAIVFQVISTDIGPEVVPVFAGSSTRIG